MPSVLMLPANVRPPLLLKFVFWKLPRVTSSRIGSGAPRILRVVSTHRQVTERNDTGRGGLGSKHTIRRQLDDRHVGVGDDSSLLVFDNAGNGARHNSL